MQACNSLLKICVAILYRRCLNKLLEKHSGNKGTFGVCRTPSRTIIMICRDRSLYACVSYHNNASFIKHKSAFTGLSMNITSFLVFTKLNHSVWCICVLAEEDYIRTACVNVQEACVRTSAVGKAWGDASIADTVVTKSGNSFRRSCSCSALLLFILPFLSSRALAQALWAGFVSHQSCHFRR